LAVRRVYLHETLTQALVLALNSQAKLDLLLADVNEIGYGS
jgi:hypothetical protein